MTPNSYLVASRLAGHTDDNVMNVMRYALVESLKRIAELEEMLDEQKCTLEFMEARSYSHADK